MATIGTADIETIKELLIQRGMKLSYLLIDRKKLIDAINCDQYIIGVTSSINENLLISEARQISRVDFSECCRENSETVLKLIDDNITDLEILKYASKETLEFIEIKNSQKDLIVSKFLRRESATPVSQIKLATAPQHCGKKELGKP